MKRRTEFTDSLENVFTPSGHKLPTNKNSLMLGLGITTRCNFDCPICFYHTVGVKNLSPSDMGVEFVEKLFSNFGKLAFVNISLQGEPFLHKDISAILNIVNKHADNIAICTNGSIISDKICLALEPIKNLKLVLSADASDISTYSFMRKGGDFTQFLRNASAFVECLGNRVEFSGVICDQNIVSLAGLGKLANSLRINVINLSLLRQTVFTRHNGIRPTARPAVENLLKTLHEVSIDTGLEINMIDMAHYYSPCSMPFFYTSILADGSIFPCCGDFQPAAVKSYDFDGIFNHIYLMSIRANLLTGRIMSACETCVNLLQ